MKDVTQLDEGWTLFHAGARLPARVPGCVHTDLLNAGLIPDPLIGTNENDVAWVGRQEWTYTTTVTTAGTHERTDLVFDGLDTAARISLGGTALGRTRNMHRSHRFDVTALGGELEVHFSSPYQEAAEVLALTGARPNVYPEPFQYIRKMASSFGWDWGPTLPTSGIWRPARLEHWSTARLAQVRPLVTVENGTGRVELRLTVERTAQGAARPSPPGPSSRASRRRPRWTATRRCWSSRCPAPTCGGPAAAGSSPCTSSTSPCSTTATRSTPGTAGSAFAPSCSTARRTSTAAASPWSSTVSASSPAA